MGCVSSVPGGAVGQKATGKVSPGVIFSFTEALSEVEAEVDKLATELTIKAAGGVISDSTTCCREVSVRTHDFRRAFASGRTRVADRSAEGGGTEETSTTSIARDEPVDDPSAYEPP